MMNTVTSTDDLALTRRQLVVRDTLTFLSLSAIVLALFFATLFLFRSFTQHRAVLARRWLLRGEMDLKQEHPAQAVQSLEVALDYAPGDTSAELLLARALAAAGRTEEATSYFLELWGAEPGSGVINLELARLAARRGEPQEAINSFRAAIYGTWEGDGAARRLAIRLELARYLQEQGQVDAARAELLVAGGNAAGDPATDMRIAELLERSGDLSDARRLYDRAARTSGDSTAALSASGRVAYEMGDFPTAQRLLGKALAQSTAGHPDSNLEEMLHVTDEVLALVPTMNLSDAERVRRILAMREIARRRTAACAQSSGSDGATQMGARLAMPEATLTARALRGNDDRQRAAIRLTYEVVAAGKSCTATPSLEDRALALLAEYNQGLAH